VYSLRYQNLHMGIPRDLERGIVYSLRYWHLRQRISGIGGREYSVQSDVSVRESWHFGGIIYSLRYRHL